MENRVFYAIATHILSHIYCVIAKSRHYFYKKTNTPIKTSAICPKKDDDSGLVQLQLRLFRPLPEGLCQPSTPPQWNFQEDAQPASPWTQPENPAHCCCDHWGGRWFPSPQRPALHGGTSHLKNGYTLTSVITPAGMTLVIHNRSVWKLNVIFS